MQFVYRYYCLLQCVRGNASVALQERMILLMILELKTVTTEKKKGEKKFNRVNSWFLVDF